MGTDITNSGDDSLNFDMIAASIRADAGDLGTFLDVLGGKLLATLPDHVEIQAPKKHKFFKKNEAPADSFGAESITAQIGDERYLIKRNGSSYKALIAQEVRGINLKTEEVELDEWITRLSNCLAELAAKNAKARQALQGLIT